jgi:CheY-like chemotaxis protein
LGVSLQTVQRWVDAGHLKAWKTLGGHRRIDAVSAESLFERQREAIGDGAARDFAAPSTADEANRAQATAATQRPVRVLVVEDDPADIALVTVLLRSVLPDADIAIVDDGFQALVEVGRQAPQLLVADVHLPHMDGFEMLRSLTIAGSLGPATIIAMSVLSQGELAQRAGLLPQVHFVSKPLDPELFIQAVSRSI